MQTAREQDAHARHVRDQVPRAQDRLDLGRGGAGDRVALVGLPVQEAAAAVGEGGDDVWGDQEGGDGGVAATEAFADYCLWVVRGCCLG